MDGSYPKGYRSSKEVLRLRSYELLSGMLETICGEPSENVAEESVINSREEEKKSDPNL